jgi:hypothetical protein
MSDKKDQKEEKVKLPKLPNEYSYRGSELISMTAEEFFAIRKAIDIALANAIETKFISIPEWISTATGAVLSEPPSQLDIKQGLAKQVTSTDKTFSEGNYQESYAAWVFPEVLGASEVFAQVHGRMVQEGVATPIAVLKAEYEANQERQEGNAAKTPPEMKVVQEGPDTPMPKQNENVEANDGPMVTAERPSKPTEQK